MPVVLLVSFAKMDRSVLSGWRTQFRGKPSVIASAPGRVNLIGEHTDYNEGFVLPAAIGWRTTVALRLADGEFSRVISEDKQHAATFRLDDPWSHGWGRYVHAVGRAIQAHYQLPQRGIEAYITSTVPRGSGLSSSAALEVAVAAAWLHALDIPVTPRDIAEIAWEAENRYVGVPCGRLDQYASALGQKGHALLMDMRDLQTESVRIPDGVRIAVLDTRTKRAVAKSAYADRVAECQRAIELLRADGADVRSLRDATREQVEGLRERNAVAYRRARHVVTENERVLAAVKALRSEDFEALGNLFSASHASLRDDYEVSCPELDAMVEAAQAAPGCIGVRMTGAGFGGCCVALVYEKRAAEFLEATAAGYCTHGFEKPDLRLTHAGNGVQTSKYS